MNVPWDLNALSLEAARRIDVECSRFESQLQAAQTAQIESCLEKFTGLERQALLQELLVLELQYLVQSGNRPQKEVYNQRFQYDAEVVDCAFKVLAGESQPRDDEQTIDLRTREASHARQRAVWSLPSGSHGTSRYLDRKKHAHGGMGEVFIAADSLVGRRVALKRLRPGRHGSQERFIAEAQITGQLEHPGIVPLYDVGMDTDGQPFYVMKFVEGCTLRQSIQEYHQCKDEAVHQLRLIQLLHVFVTLCQTVAFAHSRRVIHRDLKPDNVMLGAFGEALVLDWGVAKVLGAAENVGGALSSKLSLSGSPTVTADFSIVGSPPYISPEAASGKTEDVTEQSDVYLLGGILYEMLTGVAPRKGTSALEVLELARTSDPPTPRSLVKTVPRKLDAICLKSMSRRREDRYQSALELADDVQRYLADEPVIALPESMLARSWRWVKRHRRQMMQATFVTFALICLLVTWQQVRRANNMQQLENARREVAEFRKLADEVSFYAANSDAISESVPYYDVARAIQVSDQAIAIAKRWGPQLEQLPLPIEQPKLRDELCDMILWVLQSTLPNYANSSIEQKRHLLDGLAWATQLRPTSPSLVRLQQELQRISEHKQDVSDAAQPIAASPRAMDHFLAGEQLRQSASEDPVLRRWHDESELERTHSQIELALGEYDKALLLDAAHYWSHFQRGRCYLALSRYGEAIEAFSTCIALRDQVPWAFSARGLAFGLRSDFSEALRDLDNAISIAPQHAAARLNRGVVYRLMGPDHYNQALDDFSALLASPQDGLTVEAAFARGQVFLLQRNFAEAMKDFDSVIKQRPEFHPALELRAQVHLLQGNVNAGVQDLNQWLGIQEDSFKNNNQPARDEDAGRSKIKKLFYRGRFLRHLAQEGGPRQPVLAELAERDLSFVIKNGDNAAPVQRELAFAKRLLNRSQEALGIYEAAITMFPDDTQLRLERGWVLVQDFNNPASALLDFVKVLELDPQHAEANSGAGYCAACQKLPGEARRYAIRAVLHGGGDYLNLHNVACIYARLYRDAPNDASKDDEFAVQVLRRAVELWRRGGARAPDAIGLIRHEAEFESLKNSPLFRNWIEGEIGL